MTLPKFPERNPTFLKPPAFPTNSDTFARFQIPNLPFHVSIALLLMFADWLPERLKNVGFRYNQTHTIPIRQSAHMRNNPHVSSNPLYPTYNNSTYLLQLHSSCTCRLGRADNSKTVPAPIHRPNFRAMTLPKFAERNPTFLKPPAFPTNADTIARFQIPNLPFHVSIALLLMFADWLPERLKNVGLRSTNQQKLKPQYQGKHIQPLIVRSTARDACIIKLIIQQPHT